MSYRPKILAFAGSLRKNSFNKKLLNAAVKGAKEAGADVTVIDLKDYPMPLYDQEIEDSQGLPENAKKIKALMKQSDGFLLACPEYNSSMSGVFKNTIDWASRKETPEEPSLICFVDKGVMLMSASPGQLGGIRGLVHVRSMLNNINSIVLPQQKCVPQADKAFDEAGNIKDAKLDTEVQNLGKKLVDFLKKYKNG